MPNVLVTGANGFLGKPLVSSLTDSGYEVTGTIRGNIGTRSSSKGLRYVNLELERISGTCDEIFKDIEVVIHLAAHVHVTKFRVRGYYMFEKINVEATRILAESAARMGVKRFIFLSSAGVHGNETSDQGDGKRRFSEIDGGSPVNSYTRSKYAAEKILKDVCGDSSMEYLILRAPLVYGPGVKSNFQWLLRGIDYGFPFPLNRDGNLRSLLYVDNLIDIIKLGLHSSSVKNSVFLVSDYDVSVSELISKLALAMKRKPRICELPGWLVELLIRVPLVGNMLRGLAKSLLIDRSNLRNALNWEPVVELDEAISTTVKWYLSGKK